MSIPLSSILLFSLSLLAGLLMVDEGCLIVLAKKQITPLPTRILNGLSVLAFGKEKSRQWFSAKTSPKNLQTYASYVLIFGPLILISCFVFLFSTIL